MGHKGSVKGWTSTITCASCRETFNISLAELSMEKRNERDIVVTICPNCEKELVVHKLPESIMMFLRGAVG